MVFDHLILHYTHPGFFHGFLCQRNPGLVCSAGRRAENRVNLFLRIGGVFFLCFFYLADSLLQFFNAVYKFVLWVTHSVLLPIQNNFF